MRRRPSCRFRFGLAALLAASSASAFSGHRRRALRGEGGGDPIDRRRRRRLLAGRARHLGLGRARLSGGQVVAARRRPPARGAASRWSDGVADIPTAFVATYGTGKPVIGILAEFDALPGLSQAAVPRPEAAPGDDLGPRLRSPSLRRGFVGRRHRDRAGDRPRRGERHRARLRHAGRGGRRCQDLHGARRPVRRRRRGAALASGRPQLGRRPHQPGAHRRQVPLPRQERSRRRGAAGRPLGARRARGHGLRRRAAARAHARLHPHPLRHHLGRRGAQHRARLRRGLLLRAPSRGARWCARCGTVSCCAPRPARSPPRPRSSSSTSAASTTSCRTRAVARLAAQLARARRSRLFAGGGSIRARDPVDAARRRLRSRASARWSIAPARSTPARPTSATCRGWCRPPASTSPPGSPARRPTRGRPPPPAAPRSAARECCWRRRRWRRRRSTSSTSRRRWPRRAASSSAAWARPLRTDARAWPAAAARLSQSAQAAEMTEDRAQRAAVAAGVAGAGSLSSSIASSPSTTR